MIRNKVLVTGAAGFIGFHLSRRLLEHGDSVTCVDNLNAYYDVTLKEARLAMLREKENFHLLRADIADRDAMKRLFAENQFDLVVSLAAQPGAEKFPPPASRGRTIHVCRRGRTDKRRGFQARHHHRRGHQTFLGLVPGTL